MNLKLDENLGERGRKSLVDAGYDVATVGEQGLSSAADRHLIEVCRKEGRCLVSLDLDFSNPFIFPPDSYAGIVVLRLSRRPTPGDLDLAVQTLIRGLNHSPVFGKLWIVERGRIREYTPQEPPSGE